VRVTFQRAAGGEPLTARVVRRQARSPTVDTRRLLADGTGVVRVSSFEGHTAEEVAEAVRDLAGRGARRLVLDLRGNPGGLVRAAVATVSVFCAEGKLVATSRGRAAADDQRYVTRGAPTAPDMPLAVLVDGSSASAAELVAGALQDMGRALVVGERTFGKGVIQTIFPLGDGSALNLTTASYFLPGGRCAHIEGVRPDVAATATADARALALLASAWRDAGRDAASFQQRFGAPPPEDAQLQAAAEALRLVRP